MPVASACHKATSHPHLPWPLADSTIVSGEGEREKGMDWARAHRKETERGEAAEGNRADGRAGGRE